MRRGPSSGWDERPPLGAITRSDHVTAPSSPEDRPAAIVLAPELGLFQRILHTVHLSFREWLVCIGLGLLVVVASEIRKWLLRRSDATAVAT